IKGSDCSCITFNVPPISSPNIFTMTAGRSNSIFPKGRPQMARMCWVNWEILHASIVYGPDYSVAVPFHLSKCTLLLQTFQWQRFPRHSFPPPIFRLHVLLYLSICRTRRRAQLFYIKFDLYVHFQLMGKRLFPRIVSV